MADFAARLLASPFAVPAAGSLSPQQQQQHQSHSRIQGSMGPEGLAPIGPSAGSSSRVLGSSVQSRHQQQQRQQQQQRGEQEGSQGGDAGLGGRIDLSVYRRVVRQRQEPVDETDIIVSNSGNVRLYVAQAVKLLTGELLEGVSEQQLLQALQQRAGWSAEQQQQREAEGRRPGMDIVDRVTIRGFDQVMGKAILAAEAVRRKVPNLHLIVRAETEEALDKWMLTPAAEEENRLANESQQQDLLPRMIDVPRTVYQLSVTLAKHVTPEEMDEIGYRCPIEPGSDDFDFFQKLDRRSYTGPRHGRGGRGGRGGRRGRGGRGMERGWGYRGGSGGGRGGRRGGGSGPPGDGAGGGVSLVEARVERRSSKREANI